MLAGSAVLPLGSSGGNPLANDYYGVASNVLVTASPAGVSTGTFSVGYDSAAPSDVVVRSQFSLYVDVRLTDADPENDYAAGLGSEVLISAPPGGLTATLDATIPWSAIDTVKQIIDTSRVSVTQTSAKVEFPLGVDVNGNGLLDSVFYGFADLNFLDEGNMAFALEGGTTVEDIESLILAGGLLGDINAAVSVTDALLTFRGAVQDAGTDPPFSVSLTGTLATPVPATLPLLASALGLAGFALRRRRPAA